MHLGQFRPKYYVFSFSTIVAVPITLRFSTIQTLVAINVTSIGLAPITNHNHISLVCQVATIADPVQYFINWRFIFKLFFLSPVNLSIMSIWSKLRPAVGTGRWIFDPFLNTCYTVIVSAWKYGFVLNQTQANCTFILLDIGMFFQPSTVDVWLVRESILGAYFGRW